MSSNSNASHMSVSPQAVILFCLLGAAGAVLCAWAIFSRFYEDPPARTFESVGPDGLTQAQYMRTVRLRNYDQIKRLYGYSRRVLNPPTEDMYSDQEEY